MFSDLINYVGMLYDLMYFRVFSDLLSACQATVIDSISMNFYIKEPVTQLPMFNS